MTVATRSSPTAPTSTRPAGVLAMETGVAGRRRARLLRAIEVRERVLVPLPSGPELVSERILARRLRVFSSRDACRLRWEGCQSCPRFGRRADYLGARDLGAAAAAKHAGGQHRRREQPDRDVAKAAWGEPIRPLVGQPGPGSGCGGDRRDGGHHALHAHRAVQATGRPIPARASAGRCRRAPRRAGRSDGGPRAGG